MQAFMTPDNFIFSVLEESPRIGGFICFLKTLKNFEAGSRILPLLSKYDLSKNNDTTRGYYLWTRIIICRSTKKHVESFHFLSLREVVGMKVIKRP